MIELYENDIGPQERRQGRGPRLGRPCLPERLLADGAAAIAELGYGGGRQHDGRRAERARRTQCCRLHALLVLSVAGARAAAELVQDAPYRARMVSEPRAVLREFGLELPAETTIRVWDSTAEVRYLVLEAARWHRGLGRGGVGCDRYARRHDRRRRARRRADTGVSTASALADVDAAPVAAPLPRSNGELVFEEVWQGRALGLGVVVLELTGARWSEFATIL